MILQLSAATPTLGYPLKLPTFSTAAVGAIWRIN